MSEQLLLGLAAIIVLGTVAQWVAHRFETPSILLLLVLGVLAGPVAGVVRPDDLFGSLLRPIVALAVAIILFEGGLSLRFAELRGGAGVVRNLLMIAVPVTWVMATAGAYYILDLELPLALTFGALLVVTGPTVVGPLLGHVRPTGQVGSIAKWEGIMNDPIGAILAFLVFDAVLGGGGRRAAASVLLGVLNSVAVAAIVGLIGAAIIVLLFRRYLVPDTLHNPMTLAVVVTCFAVANFYQREAGLLATTILGLALANQRFIGVNHIAEFVENLRTLLISSLFIILAATLSVSDLAQLRLPSLIFLVALILVVRPVAVMLSTIRPRVAWRERLFLAWLAPRGIVAAAVAPVFAADLATAGYPQAERLVPLTFLVIVGTVAVYGLTLSSVARWLKVAEPNPQGVVMVGAHAWARAIARVLREEGYRVLLIDSEPRNIRAARMEGLPAFRANILSERVLDRVDLGGTGRLLALTSNDEANSLAALRFSGVFGRSEVYQLPCADDGGARGEESIVQHLRGRLLFARDATFSELTKRFESGAVVKKTPLTDKFTFDNFRSVHGHSALPLFLESETGELAVFTTETWPVPGPGQTLISLIDAAVVEERTA